MLLLSICFSSLSELHSSIKAWLSLFSCLIVVPTFCPCSIIVYIQRWLLFACRTFADFARTLALRYNQIFGTSSLPPSCMLPAIVWLIHVESVRCRNHRAVEWRRAYTMVSLLASHVVCTSIRHADREKRCTGNLDYIQKLSMCSCIYKENLSIIQQQRHAHIYKET